LSWTAQFKTCRPLARYGTIPSRAIGRRQTLAGREAVVELEERLMVRPMRDLVPAQDFAACESEAQVVA
jgi:hypothetical protein